MQTEEQIMGYRHFRVVLSMQLKNKNGEGLGTRLTQYYENANRERGCG